MKILIYIPSLDQSSGGIRQYSIALLRMLKTDVENEYYIYHDLSDTEVIEAIKCIPNHNIVTSEMIKGRQTVIKRVPDKRFKNIPGLRRIKVEEQTEVEDDLKGFCKKQEIQVIHCPYQFIPQIDNVKLITTLHDVQEMHFPQFFSPEERAYRATGYLDYLRRADFIIVSYNHIKEDLIRYFQIDRSKIEVLLLDMQNLWFEKFSEHDVANISSLVIPQHFLLYPANTWRHKNHLGLIKAIVDARERYNEILNIVCTGHQNEHFSELQELVHQNKLESQIFFVGVVEEKTLFSLYKTCRGVVIPTIYEAGSFPLYESILLNVPVICSNVTSLPETIGNNNYLFDPLKIEEISHMMIKLWKDDVFRDKNIKDIKECSKRIRHRKSSLPKLLNCYSNLIEN